MRCAPGAVVEDAAPRDTADAAAADVDYVDHALRSSMHALLRSRLHGGAQPHGKPDPAYDGVDDADIAPRRLVELDDFAVSPCAADSGAIHLDADPYLTIDLDVAGVAGTAGSGAAARGTRDALRRV